MTARARTRATQQHAAIRRQLADYTGDDGESVIVVEQDYVVRVRWLESVPVKITVVRGGRLWVALCKDGFSEEAVGE